MRRALAVLLFAALPGCASASPSPCPYSEWDNVWFGGASYTSSTATAPTGIAGASALQVVTTVTSCGAEGRVIFGECTWPGHFTGPRSFILEPSPNTCTVHLSTETIEIEMRQGSAVIAADDTLEMTIGGNLTARNGVALTDGTITFDFNGRRK